MEVPKRLFLPQLGSTLADVASGGGRCRAIAPSPSAVPGDAFRVLWSREAFQSGSSKRRRACAVVLTTEPLEVPPPTDTSDLLPLAARRRPRSWSVVVSLRSPTS